MIQEPTFITTDRKLIQETFKDLVFIDEGHKYYRGGQLLPSVSEVTHRYKPEFDMVAVSTKYASKHGQTPEYWQDEWKFKNLKATTTGTLVHEYGEGLFWLKLGMPDKLPESTKVKYIKDKGWLIPCHPKEDAILKFFQEMNVNDFPVLAETKIYNNFNPIAAPMMTSYCGTFDMLFYRNNPIQPDQGGYVIKDYKGLDITTPIFTENRGWITMETIQVGDKVYDKNGEVCKVIGTSKIHHKPCYQIKFGNDQTITCDFEHRWDILVDGELQTLTAKELYQHYMSGQDLRIPLSKSLGGMDKDFSKDLYLLENLYSSGMVLALFKYKFNGNLDEFLEKLLGASPKQRMSFLSGMIDLDGHYDHEGEDFILTFPTEDASRVIRIYEQLLGSLGTKYSLTREKDVTKIFIHATFTDHSYFFQDSHFDESDLSWKIESIEDVETIPTRCIEVDSLSHTYLFGYNFIVTHNTNKELYSDYSRTHKKMCLPPFSDLPDEAFSMYTLQLSCYQIPLEDLGLKVIGREIVWLKDNGEYEIIPVPDITSRIRTVL